MLSENYLRRAGILFADRVADDGVFIGSAFQCFSR